MRLGRMRSWACQGRSQVGRQRASHSAASLRVSVCAETQAEGAARVGTLGRTKTAHEGGPLRPVVGVIEFHRFLECHASSGTRSAWETRNLVRLGVVATVVSPVSSR